MVKSFISIASKVGNWMSVFNIFNLTDQLDKTIEYPSGW